MIDYIENFIIFDNQNATIRLYVEDQTKADALTILLPTTKTFGNVTVNVTVIPANKSTPQNTVELDPKNYKQLFFYALQGNKAVSMVHEACGTFSIGFTYIVFVKEVVQFFNDDIGDVHGLCHTLYQDIAKEIFEEHPGIFFCTDVDKANVYLGKPLGEWP